MGKPFAKSTSSVPVLHNGAGNSAQQKNRTRVTGNTITMLAGGTTTLFQVVKAVVDPSQIKMETVMDIPDGLKEKLVHSTDEKRNTDTIKNQYDI